MNDVDPDLLRLADRVAGRLWSGGVCRSGQTLYSLDDLRQEARISAWRWAQEHPEWNDSARGRHVVIDRKSVV